MQTDLILALVAVLAGAVSVLTPCVLVMLPIILGVTGAAGRRRVVGVLLGLEVSFIGISLLAAAAFAALGLPPRAQELAAVAIIALIGVTMLVPALRDRLELATSRGVARVPGLAGRAAGGEGFRGGFVGGLGLGLVWAPCAGPFLAAITAGSVTDGFTARTVFMSVGFGIGMLGPLLLVLRGGQAAVGRLRRRFGARRLEIVMGGAMLASAALIGLGGVTTVNRQIAERVNLTSTPIAGFEQRVLEDARRDDLARVRGTGDEQRSDGRPSAAELEQVGYPESHGTALDDLGPAPGLTGINETYNVAGGAKLDAEYLKGKVVIYDFWTYSCINCIRTLPFLRTWHERYADDGLVIVGLHAPEFAFEKDEDNVRDAIDDLDVTWPVATDPELRTWEAFHNRYWPAKYIADRDGNLRYVHYGEGGYEDTEAIIRELLDKEPAAAELPEPAAVDFLRNTPELYLGSERLSGESWRGLVRGTRDRITQGVADYTLANPEAPLEQDQFALTGRWEIEAESSVAAGDDSELLIHYRGRAVYLVLDPGAAASATVTVHDSAKEGGGTRRITVTGEKLYTLRDGERTADAQLRLEVPKGVSAYAFTFG